MSGNGRTTGLDDEDGLQALLRLAGTRPAVPPERAARVRSSVHGRWRASRRAETRRRLAVSLTALAAGAIFAVLTRGHAPSSPPPAVPVATVERVVGRARAHSPDARAPLALETGQVLLAGTRLETGRLERVALRMGGASVRLDEGTRVRLGGEQGLELEQGALYVDSGRGGSAVEVRTAQGVVRDVGTRFEVRTRAGELRVRARDGEVLLDRAGKLDRAGAGTELRLAGGHLERRALSAVDDDWGWTSAIAAPFELEGRRLREFLDWYSAETGRTWRLAPGLEARADTVLHGSLADLSPDEALQVVLPPCGLAARVERESVLVVAAGAEGRR